MFTYNSQKLTTEEKEKEIAKKGVEILLGKINDPKNSLHKQIQTDVLQKKKVLYIYPETSIMSKFKSTNKYWKNAFKHQDYVNEILNSGQLPKNICARINDHCVEIFTYVH